MLPTKKELVIDRKPPLPLPPPSPFILPTQKLFFEDATYTLHRFPIIVVFFISIVLAIVLHSPRIVTFFPTTTTTTAISYGSAYSYTGILQPLQKAFSSGY